VDFSYAQHLEDYHLAQAFAGQSVGFYVDVGAGHPVADNVSCWFYLQGWRGIVIEPQLALCELYAFSRPRDIAVSRIIGRSEGLVDFYLVDRLHGLSSVSPDVCRQAQGLGVSCRRQTRPATTLAAVCREFQVGQIDFLKIDVEGAEFDVLVGADWQRWRPRVVLLEALAPFTLAEAWHDWEPYLLAQGYMFVLFDGLNRFYVAEEETALIERFPKQPAPWLIVPHLGHTNRAIVRTDHPDHPFAATLITRFLANLPRLDHHQLLALIVRDKSETELAAPPAPDDFASAAAILFQGDAHQHTRAHLPKIEAATLRDLYFQLFASDAFRMVLGRIAASYDGGQILDET
jgi:FkbM family methyltransferase